MKLDVKPGKYVLAVSGGVDSMMLLDLLAKRPGIELIVAHFNHGMRPEAAKDEQLVMQRAEQLKLRFEVGYGHLGSRASEEKARRARYYFLQRVLIQHRARSIITAHHQDDLIETAILNLLRGTGRRGLVAISTNKNVLRPLLNYPKSKIIEYAKAEHLKWNEDITNADDTYLRNNIRNRTLPNLTASQRKTIILNIDKIAKMESIINTNIAKLSHYIYRNDTIDRRKFVQLPVELGNELLIFWLRQQKLLHYDKLTINRLNMSLRTSKLDSIQPVRDNLKLKINRHTAKFSYTL